MSLAEQTALTSNSPRRVPSTIRLDPKVVNDLCTHSESENTRAVGGQSATGFLFGNAERDVLIVEAFEAFPAAASAENGTPKRECLDTSFEHTLATAKTDPHLTSLHLIGWYSIRSSDDVAPLFDSDIEFHNHRFRRATDIALILRPKHHTRAAIELYSRSSSKTVISKQDYRSGSLPLGNACVNAPIDIPMRETIDEDYYLRVFQVLDSLNLAERKEGWRGIALLLKTVRPPRLEWIRNRFNFAVRAMAPKASAPPSKPTTRPSPSADASTIPEVNPPLAGTRSAQIKLRWISSAVLLALAMGLSLMWLYARPLLSALPANGLFHRIAGSTPLDMRVEPQAGGTLLVKWDGHSLAKQSVKTGSVQIDDGSEHLNLHLDSDEVANGSILYTPVSRDLTFRLEVSDGKGLPVSESMRVVNGSKFDLTAHTAPDTRPSTVAKTTSIPKEQPSSRQFDATSRAKATPPISSHSPTTASRVIPTPAQKIPAPERKTQAMRNPAAIEAPESAGGERLSTKTDQGSRAPEQRKPSEDLSPTQSLVNSPQAPRVRNSVSTRYVPARPLKQVIPSVKNLGPPSGAADVEIDVRIDDTGRVTEARVMSDRSNNEFLSSAALTAAKEWIFEPAKMYGKSVFSDHTIIFHFQPQMEQQ
jgi:TonB family protein